jgi:hypothetical protein
VSVTRVSFNGGAGTHARPTAQEQAAAGEHHIDATPQQQQHEHAAAGNHDLLASVNHGSPAIAATPRPAAFTGPGVVHARGAGGTPGGQPQAVHQAAQPGGAPRPQNASQPGGTPHPQNAAQPGGAPHPQNAARAPQPPHQGPVHQAAAPHGVPHPAPHPAQRPVHPASAHPAPHPAPHPQPHPQGGNHEHP